MSSITIRLYEHDDTRARAEDSEAEVSLHGWDHAVGDTCEVDGDVYTLASVSGSIQTGDVRGNYVVAEAERDDAFGVTFAEWLAAAGRTDTASEHDLRAAWRAGEEPSEYAAD